MTCGVPLLSLLREFKPEVQQVLRVDVVCALLVTCFTSLTGPFTGLILRNDLGATPWQLSVMASTNAAFMLSSLLWARMIDGRQPLPFVVWLTFVARSLFLLVPFVSNAWQFVAILVLANFLGTIGGPAAAALIEQVYPQAQRGRALAIVRTAGALPGILLVAGSGRLLALVGYRWVFVLAAVLGMSASLWLRRMPVPAPLERATRDGVALAGAWAAVRQDAAFRRLMIGVSIFGTGIWIQMPAHPILMADVLKITTAQAGLFAAIAGVAGLVGNGVWGRLADRWGSLRALRLVYFIGVLTPLIDVVAKSAGVFALSYVSDSLMITGLELVLTLAIIDVAGREKTARYVAISSTLAGVRGMVAPLVGAALIESVGVRAVYAVAAALMTMGALLLTWQQREPARVTAILAFERHGLRFVRRALERASA